MPTSTADGLRALVAEPRDFSRRAVQVLETRASVEERECSTEELRRAFAEYDVVWIRLAHRVTKDVVGESPRCRVLCLATTGLDHVDLEHCERVGVRVVSLRGETEFLRTITATAEHAVSLILAVLRRLPAAASSVREGRWNRDAFRGHDLAGKTVGLVGVGRVGCLVARYLAAFGTRRVGYDPSPERWPGGVERASTLDALLPGVDVLSLHPVSNAETRGLVGAAELSRLRPSTVVVNTSRGGVLDERALLAALESGRLAGAALDVLDGEPDIDGSHPLVAYAREHDNLIITPHIGGNTYESFAKTEELVAARVVAALDEMKR